MNRDSIKHALYFAPILSILYVVAFLCSTSTNMAMMSVNFIFKMAIPAAAIYIAIDCRKKLNDNISSYFNAFSYLLLLLVVASFICSICIYIYVKWIDVYFLIDLKEKSIDIMAEIGEKLGNKNLSSTTIEEVMAISYRPNIFAASSFIAYLFIDLFIAFIGAFIVKKK